MLTMFRFPPDKETLMPDGGTIEILSSVSSMCRLATGRSAIFHLIQCLPQSHVKTVLLPCYVAEGVIQPFRAAGFTVLFYRLQSNMSPLIDDVGSILQQVNGLAVFVLIHYFGFSANSSELSSVLGRYRTVIVEDCAHALFTKTPCGEPLSKYADVALYSLNKFLPVIDGAILTSNRPDIDLSLDETELPELPEEVQQSYLNHLQAGRDLFESDEPSQAKCFMQKLAESYEQYYSVINADLRPFCQSARSRRMDSNYQYGKLVKQRMLNGNVVYERLKSSTFSLLYSTLPAGVVPFCIPARVPAQQRKEIIERLFDQGVLLSTLQDKWDFIPSNQHERFSVEASFLDEHVLIPVSEFIATDAMLGMVEKLNAI